jgi:hypothetical protein
MLLDINKVLTEKDKVLINSTLNTLINLNKSTLSFLVEEIKIEMLKLKVPCLLNYLNLTKLKLNSLLEIVKKSFYSLKLPMVNVWLMLLVNSSLLSLTQIIFL